MAAVESNQNDAVPPCSWRQLAVFLGSTSALLLTFIVGTGKLLEDQPMVGGSSRVFQKWRLLDLQTEPVDWLILGDSSGDTGARPDVIEAQLGGKALNLCTMAPMLVVNDAWMLEEYIRKVGKPKQVLVVHVYDVWKRETSQMLPMIHNIPRSYGYWNRMEVQIEPPISDRFNCAVYQLLPPFSKRDTLLGYAKSGFETMPDLYDVDYVMRHQGFHLEQSSRPEWVQNIAKSHIRSMDSTAAISDVNARALDGLLALSKRHDMPLYLAASPLYEGLYNDVEFRRGYDAIANEVRRRICESGAPAVYLFDAPPLFDADQMETVDHVVGEAATREYSQKIAQAVATHRDEIVGRQLSDTVRR